MRVWIVVFGVRFFIRMLWGVCFLFIICLLNVGDWCVDVVLLYCFLKGCELFVVFFFLGVFVIYGWKECCE